MKKRQTLIGAFIKEIDVDINKIQQMIKRLINFDKSLVETCSYEDFLKYLELGKQKSFKFLFNILSDNP